MENFIFCAVVAILTGIYISEILRLVTKVTCEKL